MLRRDAPMRGKRVESEVAERRCGRSVAGGRGGGPVGGPRAPDALRVRAEEHPADGYQDGVVPDTDAGVGRTRTDAREAPADAEDDPAREDVSVERLQPSRVGPAGQRRAVEDVDTDCERGARDDRPDAQHEQQAEVLELEEVQHDFGSGHPTQAETEAEYQA